MSTFEVFVGCWMERAPLGWGCGWGGGGRERGMHRRMADNTYSPTSIPKTLIVLYVDKGGQYTMWQRFKGYNSIRRFHSHLREPAGKIENGSLLLFSPDWHNMSLASLRAWRIHSQTSLSHSHAVLFYIRLPTVGQCPLSISYRTYVNMGVRYVGPADLAYHWGRGGLLTQGCFTAVHWGL